MSWKARLESLAELVATTGGRVNFLHNQNLTSTGSTKKTVESGPSEQPAAVSHVRRSRRRTKQVVDVRPDCRIAHAVTTTRVNQRLEFCINPFLDLVGVSNDPQQLDWKQQRQK